jgi:hypothetical protein
VARETEVLEENLPPRAGLSYMTCSKAATVGTLNYETAYFAITLTSFVIVTDMTARRQREVPMLQSTLQSEPMPT